MRLIDADAMRDDWLYNGQNEYVYDTNAVLDSIDEQPTIDPESLRPRGTWEGTGDGYADGELVYDTWTCSECGYTVDTDDPDDLTKFCPNCGTKMEGGHNP